MPGAPRLLIAAHGTSSVAGAATIRDLVAAVRAARPSVPVSLCFLDVASPSLPSALDELTGPVVVVPLLLSAGYHVRTDIPVVVAGRRAVRVARHLGPDPLLADAMCERLEAVRGSLTPASTVLSGVTSSRPSAQAEVTAAAALLADRLRRPVTVLPLVGDLRAALAALPGPVEVAVYLLAEGDFLTTLRAAADGLGVVAAPIGVHPSLVGLVLARYDEALRD